jgi:hypothetical protein
MYNTNSVQYKDNRTLLKKLTVAVTFHAFIKITETLRNVILWNATSGNVMVLHSVSVIKIKNCRFLCLSDCWFYVFTGTCELAIEVHIIAQYGCSRWVSRHIILTGISKLRNMDDHTFLIQLRNLDVKHATCLCVWHKSHHVFYLQYRIWNTIIWYYTFALPGCYKAYVASSLPMFGST